MCRYGRKLRLLRRARLVATIGGAEETLAAARLKRVYAKASGVVYCSAPIAAQASGLQVVICHVTFHGTETTAGSARRSWLTRTESTTRQTEVPFQLALPDGRLTVSTDACEQGRATRTTATLTAPDRPLGFVRARRRLTPPEPS